MSFTQDKNNRQDREKLKTYFETGDRPTEDEFAEAIDSWINQLDDDIHAVDYKIGIGTDKPIAKLNVEAAGGDADSEGIIRIDSNSTLNDGNLRFGIVPDDHTWIQSHGNVPLHINRHGNNTVLNLLNGNVGIGTENPDAELEVAGKSGNANKDGILRIESDAKKGDANLRFGVVKGSYSWIQAHGSKPLHINGIGNHTILNDGGGNVGIGTSSTDEKLTLKGSLSIHDGNIKGNESTGTFKMFANMTDFDGANVVMHGKDYGNASVRGAIGFIANNSHQTSWAGNGLVDKEKAFTFSSNGGTDAKTGAGIWRSLLSIQKNGFIGINKYEPTNLLEINKSSGTDTGLKLTNGKGENKVLVSDSHGNATWVDKTSITNGLWKQVGTSNHIENGNGGFVRIGNPTSNAGIHSNLEITGSYKAHTEVGILRIQGSNGWGSSHLQFGVNNTGGSTGYSWVESHLGPLCINGESYRRVGIGETNPRSKLDVSGDYEDQDKHGILKISGDKGTSGPNLRFGIVDGDKNHGYSWIQSHGDVPLKINPHSHGNNVIINQRAGNVGIGTSSPQYKLDVNGDSNFRGNIRVNNNIPFVIKRYPFKTNTYRRTITAYSPNDYDAVVGSIQFGKMSSYVKPVAINYVDEYLIASIYVSNNQFVIEARFPDGTISGHNGGKGKKKVIEVLFIRKEIVRRDPDASEV